jgi:hypothetical protein
VRQSTAIRLLLYRVGRRSWALSSSYIAIADIDYTDHIRLPLSPKDFLWLRFPGTLLPPLVGRILPLANPRFCMIMRSWRSSFDADCTVSPSSHSGHTTHALTASHKITLSAALPELRDLHAAIFSICADMGTARTVAPTCKWGLGAVAGWSVCVSTGGSRHLSTVYATVRDPQGVVQGLSGSRP